MASGSSSARTLQQQDHEEQQAMGYPRSLGFLTTSGPDYVVALCSLFFLRALRVSDDFFLASNYQPAGKFDNVVIFYRLREDPDPAVYRAIFLQAKHKAKVSEEEPKNEQKRKHKLPFILKDYLETFKNIRYLWEQPLNFGHRRITIKDVTLVLYTNNNKCVVDEIVCDVTNNPELLDLQDFLNTGGRLLRIPQAQGAQLPQGPDSSDFLGKLLICTHQMSVETTEKFLREEIRKVLRMEDVEGELTSELKTVMKTWWSEEGRGTFLTVDSTDSADWKRILQKQMTRINSDNLAFFSRFKPAFTEEALQQLDVVSRRMKMTWIRVSDTHQASVLRVRFLSARTESLVLDAKYLDSHWAQVEALWGKSVCQTLVLDLTDYPQLKKSQLLQRLQEAAEMDARRHLVVVATEQPPSEGWNVVEHIKIPIIFHESHISVIYRYPKTKSLVTTSGPDYNVALCSLFFLRALRVSSDFLLAGNYEPAGKFDDVVLFYRLKEDSEPAVYRAIFLQAKHKDSERNALTVKDLQGYLESFTQIKNLWEQPLGFDGRQITLKEVFLILYTNSGSAVDTVASDVDDLPDLQKFLNTGDRLMRIREVPEELPEGQDTSHFLKKLLLCTQQMSVKTTDTFLLDEMCQLLGLESRDVGSELTSKLKSVVKAWWSARGTGTFLTPKSEEWQRILQMQMTRLNGDTLAVNSRMNLAFTKEALQQLDFVSQRMKMTWIPVSDTHHASVTRVRLLKARSDSLVLCAKYLDSNYAEVEALWGKSVCQTLAIDLTDYPRLKKSQLLQRLQEAALMDARRHLVVVSTEQPPSEVWNVVEHNKIPIIFHESHISVIYRYPKTRSQATTSGQDYNVALCSLFFLRALRVSSDFLLAGNYEPAGKFDDVVLFYRLKGDTDPAVYRAIFLQAKHKENTKSRTLTFSQLQGYLESFTQIKNLWEQPLVIDGRQITLKEVFVILYTNSGCAVDTVASDVDDLPDLKKFLNTRGRLMRIREAPKGLPEGHDTPHFLKKLLLCTQQMSVKTTDIFLLDEMCEVLGLESLDVGSELSSELKSVVKDWWSARGTGTFLTPKSEEWQRILQMQMTRLNGDTLAVDSRMTLAFTEEALQQLDVVSQRMKMTWIPVSDTHHASVTRVRLLKARSDSLVLGAKYLDSHWREVEALWGKSVCQTLAIDPTDYLRWEESQLLQRLQKAAEMEARRHLVVVATEQPPSKGWKVVKPLDTWSALKPQTQQRLLSLKVHLQGIPDVALLDVVGFSLSDVMTDKVIESLSVSEPAIRLGEAMTTPLDYYVPRCLQRTSSKTITYQSLQNTYALLSYYEWDDSSSVDRNINHLTIDDLEMKNKIEELIILNEQASDSEIRKMCSKFRVKGVRGRAEREGLTGEVTEFIPLTWISEDDVVVVEGLPGVGKSSYVTAMCSMAKKQFPECWVLRVDMARYTEYLKGTDFASPSDVMEFLLKAFHKDLGYLERHLLEHALRVTGNVFLFLDAFDDISPDYTAQCCCLLKGIANEVSYRQMVVTTRPVTTKYVEEALKAKAFTLPVFSREEQTSFFTKFSVASEKAVDKQSITSFQQISGDVIEIPLLCKMSADVLMNSQDQSVFQYKDPWRRILLYHLFVEQTVENRFAEKSGLEISNPEFRKLLDSNISQHLCNLQGLAVRKLMPDTELSTPYDGVPDEKFGLVVDTGESVDFEHRTFAEFFLGCWLSDNQGHCPQQLLQDGFQFVAATLSWSLFRDFPLHLAVARGDAEAVREALLLSSAGTTDRGGRSALHVAAMTPGCSREILELLVTSGGDLNREDAILATSAVKYAEVARNLDFIVVMEEKGARIENLNLLNNQEAAEEVLIQAIQRDLVNFTNCVLKLNNQLLRVRDSYDRDNTLLHIAAENNSTRVLDVLLQSGFEINVQNRYGNTALHLAKQRYTWQHWKGISLLLSY